MRKIKTKTLYGFLKASHDEQNLDIWGSFLKTKDGNMPLLGTELIKRRLDIVNCRNDIGVGANPNTTIPIMKLLKRYTAKMTHYYMLSNCEEFQIAKVSHIPILNVQQNLQYDVIKLHNIDEVIKYFDEKKYKTVIPYKDYWYIEHRFFLNPIYKYEIYGVRVKDTVEALVVIRLQSHAGKVAVRFVDYIGNKNVLPGT